MRAVLGALLFAAWGSESFAASTDWTLSLDDGTVFGTLSIDFGSGAISANIAGQFGTYLDGFGHLGTTDWINGQPVQDFFRLFDPISGTSFFEDYGNGDTYTHSVNEVAIEFGTLGAALSPLGGTFAATFHEIVNYDESYTYCAWHEDIYDETGEWIGTGGCAWTDGYSYYNQGYDEYYNGTISMVPLTAPPAPVPLPAGAVLLAGGLLALSGLRRRASCRTP